MIGFVGYSPPDRRINVLAVVNPEFASSFPARVLALNLSLLNVVCGKEQRWVSVEPYKSEGTLQVQPETEVRSGPRKG